MLKLCFKLHFSNESLLKEKTVIIKLDTCMINENYKKNLSSQVLALLMFSLIVVMFFHFVVQIYIHIQTEFG